MKLVALEIPEAPDDLPRWLERHLVGPDLAALVAELEAVHGREPGPSVRSLLGGDLDAVLGAGLGGLPASTVRQLLRRPRLLLELQELILARGGKHWDRLAREASDPAVERGRKRLLAALAGQGREGSGRNEPIPRVPWHRRPVTLALATAASVLIAVLAIESNRSPALAAWGWARPDAFPADLPRSTYLIRLADEADEWFRQRTDDPRDLARRIAEFRQGCSALILADHRPLPPGDRDWLVGKCREWAGKFDAHLAAVEAGRPPEEVRAEADETARMLLAALRERALMGE